MSPIPYCLSVHTVVCGVCLQSDDTFLAMRQMAFGRPGNPSHQWTSPHLLSAFPNVREHHPTLPHHQRSITIQGWQKRGTGIKTPKASKSRGTAIRFTYITFSNSSNWSHRFDSDFVALKQFKVINCPIQSSSQSVTLNSPDS